MLMCGKITGKIRLRSAETLGVVVSIVSRLSMDDTDMAQHTTAPQEKKCKGHCGRTLPLSEFYLYRRLSDGHQTTCKQCSRDYALAWADRNRERARTASREYQRRFKRDNPEAWRRKHRQGTLRRAHGISLETFEEMSAAQQGLCAICHKPELSRHGHLNVDHDHQTGKIRGLLCNGCNGALGLVFDDPAILRAMIRYLEQHATTKEKQHELQRGNQE